MRILIAVASFLLAGNLFAVELVSGTYESEGVFVTASGQGGFTANVDFRVGETVVNVDESFTVNGNTISLSYSIMRQPLFDVMGVDGKIGEGYCMELLGQDILQCQLNHIVDGISYNNVISFSQQGIFRSGRLITPDATKYAWTDVLTLIQ